MCEHQLPAYWLHMRLSPEQFLDRLAEVARAQGSFSDVARDRFEAGLPDGIERLRLTPLGHSDHCELLGQAWSVPGYPGVIELGASAREWSPDPATRPVYDQAVRAIFDSLVALYNRRYRATMQIQVGELPSRDRRLPPATALLLNHFILAAQGKPSRKWNWDSFYRFVRHCHDYRVHLPCHRLRQIAIEAGLPEAASEEISSVYGHCRRVLATFYGPRSASRFLREGWAA